MDKATPYKLRHSILKVNVRERNRHKMYATRENTSFEGTVQYMKNKLGLQNGKRRAER